MMKQLLCFALCSFALPLMAQPVIVDLWNGHIPGAIVDTSYHEMSVFPDGFPRISNVSDPALSVYLPHQGTTPTAAVIICPGGAYGRLAMGHEGTQVAEWFNSIGVAGIVLKYRLPSDKIMQNKTIGPLQDAQETVRLVRRHAKEWNIDPSKVGVIGFSAGGHLASTLATRFTDNVYSPSDTVAARPDFAILVYPVISMQDSLTHAVSRENLLGKNPSSELVQHYSNERQVTSQTPPCFLVHSSIDPSVNYLNSVLFYQALVKNHVSSELHLYDIGGHGFGLAISKLGPAAWTSALKAWLERTVIAK
jgi:acetyl esterase/lipase